MGSPPNIGGVISGSVLEDSGAVVTGQLTETANNWGNTWSISSGASYGTVTINPSTGLWSYVLNNANPVVDALDGGDTLTDIFVVAVSDAAGSDTQTITITINGITCFAAETLIDTAEGPRPAGRIRTGDLVRTKDHGLQPVRWAGMRRVSRAEMIARPTLQPVRIAAGALGEGVPGADVTVSRQRRILIASPVAQLLLDESEVLVPAHALAGLPGVEQVLPEAGVDYVHLLFDRHEVVMAEGLASESFYPGPQAMEMLAPEDRATVAALVAAQGGMVPARPFPEGRRLRLLVDAFAAPLRAAATATGRRDPVATGPQRVA